MTLFRQSGAGFVVLTLEQQFALRIAEQMQFHTGHRASPAEVRSWERSLPVLAQDLEQAGLGKVEVLVEHHLPLTSKRADVVLAGRHPRTGAPSYVVIELKQWSRAAAWDEDRELVLIDGYPNAPRLHPVAQVRGYCEYLADFAKFLDGQPDAVAGAAYLHNAMAEADVRDLYDYPQDSRGQLFTGARRGEFIEFLRDRLDPDVPGSPYADQLINSAIAPSKQLLRTGRRQVDELIAAARVPVFLLDQHQVVKPGELGTVDEIKQYAADLGFPVHVVELDAQFRCGGSEEYVHWVQRLLGLSAGGPVEWQGDPAFEVRVADSPEAMESLLRDKMAAGYGARISAGYCWPWSDPRPDKTLVDDVQLGRWARPWNVKGDRKVGEAPPAALWATDPNGFDQVGCIYTAQGFEYDWSGVILGPDLVWRDGRLTAVRDANRDPAFSNRKATDNAAFDRLVRNTYKVLLTRGMVGTVLYSPDAETRDALHDLVTTTG